MSVPFSFCKKKKNKLFLQSLNLGSVLTWKRAFTSILFQVYMNSSQYHSHIMVILKQEDLTLHADDAIY